MDSTIFIRRRRVLAVWLLVPVLVIAVAEIGARSFYNYQQASYLRKQALDKWIPDMIVEEAGFDRFVKGYLLNTTKALSIEDSSIELVNEAADAAGFKITSIDVVPERDAKLNIINVAVNLNGIGTCRSVIAFLQQVKTQDPFFYEKRIDMTRTDENRDILRVEAQLGKIYIENGGVRR